MAGSTKKTFKKGDVLIREGDKGDRAYIIESGQVEILVQRENKLIQIGARGAGSIIGEMAIVDDKPRTATVRALEDCQVMEITREDFSHRIESADPILKMIVRVIMSRYRDVISRSQFIPLPFHFAAIAEESENSGDLHDLAVRTIRMQSELKEALEKNQLTLFYQPIIDVQSMKIAGFEALMRWKHPEKGMIPPGVFIPVAEESGIILDMSRWAFGVACDTANKMNELSKDPLFVSVNFSVKDFLDGSIAGQIEKTLKEKNTPPERLHLEITETLLMETPSTAKDALEKCRELGMHISIDDFGTGYSSLSYLHYFPIDTLKIDQSFVRSMQNQENNMALIHSIIGLAHNLKMKVIAEGVETEKEAAILKKAGCEECQGYWFAKPMPLEDALDFVKNWKPPQIN